MTRKHPIKEEIPNQSEKHVVCKGLGDKLLTMVGTLGEWIFIHLSLNIQSTCDGKKTNVRI